MRVLVCGSRTFGRVLDHEDTEHADKKRREWAVGQYVLEGIYSTESGWGNKVTFIHGGAMGADQMPEEFSGVCAIEPYPADWSRYGKSAGYIRNQQMLDEGKPDMVLAFVDKPLEESKGTRNMVHLAKLAGVPTYVIQAVS